MSIHVFAVQRTRSRCRDKAVLCNIRQLAAAADQYFLENGTTVVLRYEGSVGPDKYIKALNSFAGEDYRQNFPLRQGAVLSADFPSGRIINYATGANPPGYKDIFEPGERPPWRTPAPAAVAAGTAPALDPAAFTRQHAQSGHNVRRGTMCASCHARK